jgi:tetratricopeptide (TPR) repeat protein
MMSKSPLIFSVAAVTILAFSPVQGGAPADSKSWRLVAQGQAFIAANLLKEAEQSFKKALKKDRHLTAAMAGLGQLYVAKKNWGEANEWYEKVLEQEPENLDAHYHRAICYRECGVPKAMILQAGLGSCGQHFKLVLAADSSFTTRSINTRCCCAIARITPTPS